MLKKLVIYYSLEGNTEVLAKSIADEIGAELLKLRPEKPISSKGFTKFFWGGKQAVMKQKPALLPIEKSLNDYDLIVLGTPIWAGSYNPVFRTLLSSVTLQKKHIAFFCSCANNGRKAFANLRQELTGNTILGEFEFQEALKSTDIADREIRKWARKTLSVKDGQA